MFVRNLLQAGDYVTCVPVGIPVTLQYGESGNIEKILMYHEDANRVDISKLALSVTTINHVAPTHIPVKGGTTYVYGVLHTNKLYTAKGSLPECIVDEALKDYVDGPEHFKFYAGHVKSLATTFRGSVSIRQWLTVAGFSCLPGYVVPVDLDESKFSDLVAGRFPFRYPLITSYILFQKTGEVTFPKTRLSQLVIKRVEKVVDQNGYIFGQLKTKDAKVSLQVPYSTVVSLDIQTNSLVILDSDGDCIAAIPTDNADREKRSRRLQCPTCGRFIQIPTEGPVKCSDSHCNSVLYPRVNYMLSKLNFPTMTYSRYQEVTKSIGSIFSLPDVFDLPEYNELKMSHPMSAVIRAVVPRSILTNDTQVNAICNACNDSKEVLTYYVDHPDRMMTDLELVPSIYGNFFAWISDNENAADLKALMSCKNISIASSDKKFNGAPIFRGKTIMITGTFSHGSLSEIAGILSSYSASVTQKYGKGVDCVLVGDLDENTNAYAVKDALKNRIPVMQESSFFSQYDIDSDLAENL